MKRHLLAALLALTFADVALAADYTINDRHTQVLFTYTHMGFSHITGRLTQPSGTFKFDPAAPTNSSIDVDLPMSSLSFGIPALDNDLRGEHFFDVGKFPTAHFKSNKVTSTGKNQLDVVGDLTIHGVTQPVVFRVTINGIGLHPMYKVPAAGFDATATIKRSAFGVGGLLMAASDDVELHITMEAQQAKAN
jgi:polyisoprenoid-binding protein YceI